jgi:hypothetical protein
MIYSGNEKRNVIKIVSMGLVCSSPLVAPFELLPSKAGVRMSISILAPQVDCASLLFA